MSIPILERGISRPYPGVNQVVLSGDTECCDDATTCMDAVTITDIAVVQGIVLTLVNGTSVPITFPATATGRVAVVAAVQAAMLPYEQGIIVYSTIVVAGTSYSLRHEGQTLLASVTIGGSPSATARTCTTKLRCTYAASINGSTTAIVVNGTSRAFSAALVYGTDTAANAITKIQTAVNLASLPGGAVVTVIDNTVALRFDVKISSRQGNTFSIGVVSFQESACILVFE